MILSNRFPNGIGHQRVQFFQSGPHQADLGLEFLVQLRYAGGILHKSREHAASLAQIHIRLDSVSRPTSSWQPSYPPHC